ncbi:hypothetical protein QJ531_09600 [Lacticaseibacillus rhamnosus]|nr:hypothetical protein [Lacticaseibacillus rhamnosus]
MEMVKDPSCKGLYRTNQTNFEKIPGSPLSYWVPWKLENKWAKSGLIGSLFPVRKGLVSGDNALLLRFWQEPTFNAIAMNPDNQKKWVISPRKYVRLNEGGNFRKWYGNQEYIIRFDNQAYLLIDKNKGHRSPEYYFSPALTWSAVTSGQPSFRYSEYGLVGGSGGYSVYLSNQNYSEMLAFLNSKVTRYMLDALNPTINIQAGDVKRLPFKPFSDDLCRTSVSLAIQLSKNDWNSFESSINFDRSPILNHIAEHNPLTIWLILLFTCLIRITSSPPSQTMAT